VLQGGARARRLGWPKASLDRPAPAKPGQAATALDAALLLHDGLRKRRDNGFGCTIGRLLD
jgi:hypothetical protein